MEKVIIDLLQKNLNFDTQNNQWHKLTKVVLAWKVIDINDIKHILGPMFPYHINVEQAESLEVWWNLKLSIIMSVLIWGMIINIK